ncbi:Protein of unknown function, partial [Gryllus bimaculatus]
MPLPHSNHFFYMKEKKRSNQGEERWFGLKSNQKYVGKDSHCFDVTRFIEQNLVEWVTLGPDEDNLLCREDQTDRIYHRIIGVALPFSVYLPRHSLCKLLLQNGYLAFKYNIPSYKTFQAFST